MRRRTASSCLAFLTVAASSGLAEAASYRLSSGQTFSDVGAIGELGVDLPRLPIVSPDGRHAVYIHDAETDGADELWRAPLHGGSPARISGLLPSGESASAFRFTPDGLHVLYNAHQDFLERLDLYAAPIDAPSGSFVKINDPLPTGYEALWVATSPDSTQVVYAVCAGPGQCYSFHLAQVDGSADAEIYSTPESYEIYSQQVSADFARVVFTEHSTKAGRTELFSVATSGGEVTHLNGALVDGGNVGETFALSHAGDRVAYLADQQTNDRTELYVVSIGGGSPVKISPALGASDDVSGAVFAEGDAYVVYFIDSPSAVTNVWSSTPDGAQKTRLNLPLPAGGTVSGAGPFLGGSRVVYVAEQETDGVAELYSVPTGGGTPVKLSVPLIAGRAISNIAFSPDEAKIFYVADASVDERYELWVVPTAGGATIRVSQQLFGLGADWDVQTLAATADSYGIAYVFEAKTCGACPYNSRLYRGNAHSDDPVRLDACPGAINQVVATPVASPVDPLHVLYYADQETNGKYDLFLGDGCLLCDGFEAGEPLRWSATAP